MKFVNLLSLLTAVSIVWPVQAAGFGLSEVAKQAKALAQKPYTAPPSIPKFLRDLSYDEYQGIRFKPEQSLWRSDSSRFQVMLISPGRYYNQAVEINVVDKTGIHPVAYRKNDFTFPSRKLEKQIPPGLGFAGFKLTYPLQSPEVRNQFLVFAGASYFRGVGKNNVFGLSARGIAVDTGLSIGEQFPAFVAYWLKRPDPKAEVMTFYALLNGLSLTGAYRFLVTPGETTKLLVKAVLFPRKKVKLAGIAPLTSMFYYGENTPRPAAQWRPQVHDSGGLLLRNGSTGEWLWRPLVNPKRIQTDYFETENVKGFGLLQRQTRFGQYQDMGARYDKRPSAWITPQGDWEQGDVVLVQLPTDSETEDNIVAFWTPKQRVEPGRPLTYTYTVSFGGDGLARENMAHAAATFVGSGDVIGGGNVKGAYRFVIDFAGGPLTALPANAPVTSDVSTEEGGTVIEHFVQYVRPLHQWRLSILAKPAVDGPLVLRAFLKKADQTLTETWTYRLPWDNKIAREAPTHSHP